MKLHDEVSRIPIKSIDANEWNPNEQSAFIFEKEKNSIRKFGFIDPILVRKKGKKYEIIDGEHRYRAAKELEMEYISAITLNVTDEEAKSLTIIMNEVRGEADPAKLSRLLNDINTQVSLDDLKSLMPYTDKELLNIMSISSLSWDDITSPLAAEKKQVIEEQPVTNGIVQTRAQSNVKTVMLRLPDDLYDRLHACFYELGVNIETEEPAWETMNDFVTALEEWIKTRAPED